MGHALQHGVEGVVSVADELAARIRRNGPITFAEYQDVALYGDGGFFAAGHGAGRAGADFVTSPEVGSLFGTLVARQLDATWDRLGAPDPFVVVEAGAGRGRLASDVLRAAPACTTALRYVLVERSPALRAAQRDVVTLEAPDEVLGPVLHGADPDDPVEAVRGMGPLVTAIDDLPGAPFVGLVVANELLDNLPARIVERTDAGWGEVRVALADDGTFAETVVPAAAELATEADLVANDAAIPVGARLPVPEAAAEWLAHVGMVLHRGEVVLVDYFATVEELLERSPMGWLRTFQGHQRGEGPLREPGAHDITMDVPITYLRPIARRAGFEVRDVTTQREWLATLGIDALVEEGNAIWRERAHLGDLEAIAGRSRAGEADALTDPAGLGAHRVVVLARTLG